MVKNSGSTFYGAETTANDECDNRATNLRAVKHRQFDRLQATCIAIVDEDEIRI